VQNATGQSSTPSNTEGSPVATASTGITFQPSEVSTLPTTLTTAPGIPIIPSSTSGYQAGAAGATGTGVNGAGSNGSSTGSNGTYDAPTAQISPFLGAAADVGYDAAMLLCFTVAVISAVVLI
jgi:hypothetical protein